MLKGVALSLLVCGVALAGGNSELDETSKKIIGVEVGASTIKADTIYSPVISIAESGHESTYAEWGIRLGAEKKDWRTLFVLNYFNNSDDDQKYWKGLSEFDYYITNVNGLKPYLGVNLGYMNYESTDIDTSGFIYGGQAGVQFEASENIELDFSYRYSASKMDEVDHTGSFTFGLDYIF